MARIVPAVRGMYIALTLHLLWTLGAAAVITRRQRIPASAAAWLALVFLLPVAGTLLYVLAGYRRAVPAAEPCDCRGDAVEQIVARGCGTRPAPRNSVSLLHNGSNAFTPPCNTPSARSTWSITSFATTASGAPSPKS